MVVDVARYGVPGDRLARDHYRRGQESALCADLDPGRACRRRVRHATRPVVGGPAGREARSRNGGDHLDFGVRPAVGRDYSRVRHIPLQVLEPVVGGVQDAEPVSFGLNGQIRVGGAVDEGRIHEGLHDHGGLWRARYHRRLERVGRVIIRVGDGAVGYAGRRRHVPRAVAPPAEVVHAEEVVRVLVRHVDVRVPEVAAVRRTGRRAPVPRGVLGRDCAGVDERLVLDDQGDAEVGQ